MISAPFLMDSLSRGCPLLTLIHVHRSKVKTVHERIPLAGLSKLPSVPQIAKVRTNPCDKVPSFFLAWGYGGGNRLVLRGLCPWRGEGHCTLWPLTVWMGWRRTTGRCPRLSYDLPISSSQLRLLVVSTLKFTAGSGDQRNRKEGWLWRVL